MTLLANARSGRYSAVLAGAIALAAVLLSTWLLYLIIWENGMWGRWDAARFLNGAVNLVHGNGITTRTYISHDDGIEPVPITHSTPLVAIVYAATMLLGLPYLSTPLVVSLVFRVLLLVATGWLAYRLSASWLAAALTVVLVSITESTFYLSMSINSETIFLPILVLVMIVLVDLNQRESEVVPRLGIAVILLTLLVLARYVGVVILAAVMLWWFWSRVYQRRFKPLLWELPMLGAAMLPLLVWLFSNRQNQRVRAFGEHFEQGNDTFIDGILGVLHSTSQIVFPFRTGFLGDLSWVEFVWHLPILALLGYLIWRYVPRPKQLLAPHRSPILLAIAAYIALYTIVQPFMLFCPMDDRDVTTVLCLIHPWLFGMFGQIRNRWASIGLSVFVMGNVSFLVIRLALGGLSGLISLNPPALRDFSREPAEVRQQYIDQGIPAALLPIAPRTNTIQRYNPDLAAFLQQFDDLMVVSTIPNILFYTDIGHKPFVKYELKLEGSSYDGWLARGSCYPDLINTAVIISEWDFVVRERDPADLRQKCPGAAYALIDHSLVYRLDQTIPEYELAQAYAEEGNWQQALAIYNAALDFNPNNVRAYTDRGEAYLRLQRWEQALSDFDQSIARMPGWPQSYRLRGETYRSLGDMERARADITQATNLERAMANSKIGYHHDTDH